MQPRVMKDIKFIGHSLKSITNFTREYPRILKVLEGLTLDKEKMDIAEGFLTTVTAIEFRLSLCFLQDILTLLSYFSKMMQVDQCTLADYYNTKEKLIHVLQNLKLNLELTPLAALAFPNYSNLLNMDVSEFVVIPQTRITRYSNKPDAASITQSLVKKHQTFLETLTKAIKERFSPTYIPQHDEIRSAAILLNDLCESFIDSTDKLVFCGICGGLYKSLSLRSHHLKVHEGKSLIEQSFDLSSFKTEKGPPIFRNLKKVVKTDISDYQLMDEYVVFKEYFNKAVEEVSKLNHQLTLCKVTKHLYSSKEVQNLPRNMRELVLRIVTVSTSEAICESYGSKMEDYHRRFTNSDIDDQQVQVEMFINEVGPPVGKCLPFIRASLNVFGKRFTLVNENSRFIGRGKVIDRKMNEPYNYPFKFNN